MAGECFGEQGRGNAVDAQCFVGRPEILLALPLVGQRAMCDQYSVERSIGGEPVDELADCTGVSKVGLDDADHRSGAAHL
ncbi:hypothetical protein D3C72_2245980 [compost metagenome]